MTWHFVNILGFRGFGPLAWGSFIALQNLLGTRAPVFAPETQSDRRQGLLFLQQFGVWVGLDSYKLSFLELQREAA